MRKDMYDTLDKFFAEKTIQDVNRDTFLVCNLTDRVNKLTFSLVFVRDWDSLETDEYNTILVEGKGAVLTFPCYWVSVPKELAIPYFVYIIDTIYSTEFPYASNEIMDDGSGNTGNGNGNCGCIKPPPPPMPPTNQCPPCGVV